MDICLIEDSPVPTAKELCSLASDYNERQKKVPLNQTVNILQNYARHGYTEVTLSDVAERHPGYTGIFWGVSDHNTRVFYQEGVIEGLKQLGYKIEEAVETKNEKCTIYKEELETRDIGRFWEFFGFERFQVHRVSKDVEESVELKIRKITIKWCCEEKV